VSSGKRSIAVTTRLRSELKQSQEARQRLERRLAESERDRDELRKWKQEATEVAHPAITAERLRADEAVAKVAAEVERENARWTAMIERLRPWVARLSEDAMHLMSYDECEVLCELFGGDEILPGATRTARRNAASQSELRRTIKRAQETDWDDGSLAAWTRSPAGHIASAGEGAARGLAAVEAARQRRLAREASEPAA